MAQGLEAEFGHGLGIAVDADNPAEFISLDFTVGPDNWTNVTRLVWEPEREKP